MRGMIGSKQMNFWVKKNFMSNFLFFPQRSIKNQFFTGGGEFLKIYTHVER